MGLFDIFTTDAQQNAANSQIQGLQSAAGAYNTAAGQGINNLTGYTQAGLGNLADLYGQGRGALTSGAGQAAGALTSGAGQAAGALTSAYGAGLQPFYQNYAQGQQGTTQYGNAMGLNGPAGNAAATAGFWNNPAIKSQLDIGTQNALRGASQAGTLTSGGTLASLDQLGQQIASQGWQNYISNLSPYFGVEQNAAQGIGNLQSGLGNQLANVYGGLGQSLAGVYGGLGSGLNQSFTGQGETTNATNTGLGRGLASIYGGMANMGYGNQVGQGNAQANADLASLTASGNLWGLGLGLAGAGAGSAGSGVGKTLANAGSNLGSGLMSLYNKLPGFAEGGRPPAGEPAIVGEQGPELFVPDQPGTVLPRRNLYDAYARTRPGIEDRRFMTSPNNPLTKSGFVSTFKQPGAIRPMPPAHGDLDPRQREIYEAMFGNQPPPINIPLPRPDPRGHHVLERRGYGEPPVKALRDDSTRLPRPAWY